MLLPGIYGMTVSSGVVVRALRQSTRRTGRTPDRIRHLERSAVDVWRNVGSLSEPESSGYRGLVKGFRSLPFPGDDVCPQRFDVVGLQQIVPGWHGPDAVRDHVDEAGMVARGKFAEVDRPRWVGQPRPVARHAVGRVEGRTPRDLLRGKRLSLGGLRQGARPRQDQAKAEPSHPPHPGPP